VDDHCDVVAFGAHRLELAGLPVERGPEGFCARDCGRGRPRGGRQVDVELAFGDFLECLPGALPEGEFRGAGEREERFSAGVAEVVFDFARRKQDVQGDDDRSRLERTEVDEGKVRDVRTGERNLVPGSDTDVNEEYGDL